MQRLTTLAESLGMISVVAEHFSFTNGRLLTCTWSFRKTTRWPGLVWAHLSSTSVIIIIDGYCKCVFWECILVRSQAAWQHVHTQLIEYWSVRDDTRSVQIKAFTVTVHTLRMLEDTTEGASCAQLFTSVLRRHYFQSDLELCSYFIRKDLLTGVTKLACGLVSEV